MSRNYYIESDLTYLFSSSLPEGEIDLISTNPLVHFTYEREDYYVMLRNVSYAGNPHPKHRFRAQMPQKDYLENYKNSDGIFMFMGYDSANDVYVLWNPAKQRSRINLRKSVSLFCELDVLEKAPYEGIIWGELSNGGMYVAFTIENIEKVLDELSRFDLEKEEVNTAKYSSPSDLTEKIIRMLDAGHSKLEIITYCLENFSNQNPDWDYSRWRNHIIDIQNNADDIIEVNDDQKDLSFYTRLIENLGKKNKVTICKWILLLSTIEYIEWLLRNGYNVDKIPVLAVWEGIYIRHYKKYYPAKRTTTLFSNPFILMNEESFWENRLYQNIEKENLRKHAYSTFDKLQDAYEYAVLEDDFVSLLMNEDNRKIIVTHIEALLLHNT